MSTAWISNQNQNQKPEMIHLEEKSINPYAIAYINWNSQTQGNAHLVRFIGADTERQSLIVRDEEDKKTLEEFFSKSF